MDLMPLVFTNGWASGVNAYLVVLILGMADRFGSFADIPDALARWDVLAVASVLYVMEFVADKIPYIDSTWDAISTAIRPTAGAVIALLIAGDATTLEQAVYATVGGGIALLSHLVKAGIRVGINSSPEPVTNVTASVAEDLTVAGVVTLAIFHPWLALSIAAVLLVVGLVLVFFVFRTARRVWLRRSSRSSRSEAASGGRPS